MSLFEALSIITACVALAVSLVVWHGQRKLQKESNELQRATAELSRRQLESMEKEDAASKIANLQFDLEFQSSGTYVLALTNFGPSQALNVTLSPVGVGIEDSLFIKEELEAKFPLKRLLPGTRVGLMARVYVGSPPYYLVHLEWEDGTGKRSEEVRVAV